MGEGYLGLVLSRCYAVCSHVAGAGDGLHDASAAHDRDKEHNRDGLKHEVDEREEECDGADVLEGLPRVGVLEGLAVPDLAHHDDPQHVHDDRHRSQQYQLNAEREATNGELVNGFLRCGRVLICATQLGSIYLQSWRPC